MAIFLVRVLLRSLPGQGPEKFFPLVRGIRAQRHVAFGAAVRASSCMTGAKGVMNF
jgi:hypothetical protein